MKKLICLALAICMLLTLASVAMAEENVWVCESCGEENSYNFCENCGAARPSIEWTCPNCERVNKGNFCPNCGTAKPSDEATTTDEATTQYNVGDIVTFGNYAGEPIEWLVLDAEGDTRTLISVKGLEAKPYNTEDEDVTWETCTLRRWLNGEFLNEAFTADEQAMLETVTVTADENPDYSTDPGNDTQDKVWLLSITEVEKYFATDEDRICYPTQNAIDNGAWTNDSGTCWWWLRSPGNISDHAARVSSDGSVDYDGSDVDVGIGVVRPVVVLRLS